jgi:hypothetical protein
MRLYQLIYQSQAMVPFEAPELLALHQQAQAYNHAHGIASVLLHTADGRLLQLLEGDETIVRHLYYQRIAPDSRHRDCRIVAQGPALVPTLAGWPLEIRAALPADLRALLAHVPSGNRALCVPRTRTAPELAEALRAFLATGQAEAHEPQLA